MTSPSPRRISQIIRLRPSSLQAYKDCHTAVWPAVLCQIKECNITDYSIFLDETLSAPASAAGGNNDQQQQQQQQQYFCTLFAVMKYTGTDFKADMKKMRENEEVKRWWEMTDAMQVSLVEGSVGSPDGKGWWKDLEEIFRCE